MTRVVVHDEAIRELVNDPLGGIAAELLRVAQEIRDETKAHLSVKVSPAEQRVTNPTDVPRERSGRLKESIGVSGPGEIDGYIAFGVGADFEKAPHARVLLGIDEPRKGHKKRTWQLAPDRIINANRQR